MKPLDGVSLLRQITIIVIGMLMIINHHGVIQMMGLLLIIMKLPKKSHGTIDTMKMEVRENMIIIE